MAYRRLQSLTGGFLSSLGAGVIWHSSRDLKLLILLRFIRLVGYGGTTFVLAMYLNALGFHDSQIGLFMTLTLVGDLVISFVLTYIGDRMGVRLTAMIGALLMSLGGVAFAWLENYWLLLIASVFGVINPSANEIDPFKAIEESAISRLSTPETCNDFFSWWSMLGMLGTAASNMLTGWVLVAFQDAGLREIDSHRAIFLGYAGIGLLKLLFSLFLTREVERGTVSDSRKVERPPTPEYSTPEYSSSDSSLISEGEYDYSAPLIAGDHTLDYGAVVAATETGEVRSEVRALETTPKRMFTPESFSFMWKLSLAMAFDFIGSGLAQISWMTYFFKREYDIAEGPLGSATFTAGIISSLLNLASSPLSRAIGQVQTMVICHTINSISLLIVSVPGDKYVALAIFFFRIVTRELDNAPRQTFISGGVLHEERTSAMGVVNIVKTVGSCLGLYLTGLFAGMDQFWLAFIAAGALKLVYNALISAFFWRGHREVRQ